MNRKVIFEPNARDEYEQWKEENAAIVDRIKKLIKDIKKNPFKGLGKPEALKHGLSGWWSRRIDQANRLVYTVTDDAIIIMSCKYHYKKKNK